jgi:hypothetical protein
MKIRMIHKYGGQSLSAVACELGFAISTANTIVKDAACITEHVNFIFDVIHSFIHSFISKSNRSRYRSYKPLDID